MSLDYNKLGAINISAHYHRGIFDDPIHSKNTCQACFILFSSDDKVLICASCYEDIRDLRKAYIYTLE
jgi:rRNA maturation endonuclease Nob1